MLAMTKYAIPKKPGIYTLVIEVTQQIKREIGKLGCHILPKGFYTYTGSAIGLRSMNLKVRVKRHLELKKKRHWHIDYLLNSEAASVRAVVYLVTNSKIECQIAKKMKELNEANIIIKGFGSSDCHEGCKSHLHYFDINFEELLVSVIKLYEMFGFPKNLKVEVIK